MAALHGKKSRIYIETSTGSGTEPLKVVPTGFTKVTSAHTFRDTLSKDLAEASVFGDENHLSEAGLKGGSKTFSSRYTSATLAILMGIYNSDDTFKVISRPEGDVVGAFQFHAPYHLESLEVGASVGDLVDVTVTLRRNGAITYAAITA